MRLSDRQILDVLEAARTSRAVVLVHAENHEILTWLAEKLEDRGRTALRFHAASPGTPVERTRAVPVSDGAATITVWRSIAIGMTKPSL